MDNCIMADAKSFMLCCGFDRGIFTPTRSLTAPACPHASKQTTGRLFCIASSTTCGVPSIMLVNKNKSHCRINCSTRSWGIEPCQTTMSLIPNSVANCLYLAFQHPSRYPQYAILRFACRAMLRLSLMPNQAACGNQIFQPTECRKTFCRHWYQHCTLSLHSNPSRWWE